MLLFSFLLALDTLASRDYPGSVGEMSAQTVMECGYGEFNCMAQKYLMHFRQTLS